jgi:hypothetical protein
MKLFFEICKEFFDLLYLPFVNEIIEDDNIENNIIRQELDEENGYQQEEDTQLIPDFQLIPDVQYRQEKKDIEENIEEDDDDFCSCEFLIQVISIINTRIYKQLNDNKIE